MTLHIEDVRPNDVVRSRNESTGQEAYVTVKALHDHGVIDVVKVTLTSGEVIECSRDHKFRTSCGQMLPLWQIERDGLDIVVG